MTGARVSCLVVAAGVFVGVFWNGPRALDHFVVALAVIPLVALVDGARIWRLNR